jgi:PPP family 3-phenylpropionic acid transporter
MPPSGAPIAIFYLALAGALGFYQPYLSLYLSSVGLSESEAVQVQAVVPFVGLLAPTLAGLLADARHARIWLLRGLSAAAALAFASLALAGGNLIAIAALLAGFALVRAPLVALADATAHEHVRLHGGSYGRLRTWGSLGYLLAVLCAGALYDATSIRTMIWTTASALAALFACAWRMPAPPPRREVGLRGDIRRLLATRSLWLFLAAVATGQAAGVCYDTMLALHLGHLGYGKDFVGLVVGIGVAAEVVLLALSGPLLSRLRSERALAVAFAVAALRWLVLSAVTSRAALVAQAPLHAITFGLYWASATTLVRDYTGPRTSAAGQGLLGAAVTVGTILGNVYGGPLLERGGGQLVYACAAGIAAVAAALATVHALALGRSRRASPPPEA